MPEVRSGSPELDKLLVALKTPGIVGVDLMAVARWVEISTKQDTDTAIPRLLLPPIRRSAVWRWSQLTASQARHRAFSSSPCMCSTPMLPARSCRSSTFWLTRVSVPPRSARPVSS